MLFKLLVPFTLAVVIAQRTTTPVFDFPDVILRADIPAGITVHEGDASAAALEALAAPKLESRGLLERDSNCKGANPSCKWYVATRDCIQAYERFVDDDYYCGYASRVHRPCTAIYRCYDGYEGCLKGIFMKEQFGFIYSKQGCRKCGTWEIPDQVLLHRCTVTFNYCHNCIDVGP